MIELILENRFIAAQIFGVFAMTCSITAWQMKNPRNILRCYVPSALLWAIQYGLLSTPIAMMTCLLAATKDGVLSSIAADKAKYVILVFIAMVWGIGLPMVDRPLDFIPLLTISAFNFSLLWPDNRQLIARMNVLSQAAWIIFNVQVGAWLGVTCCILVSTSAIIGMIRHEKWEIGRCYRTFFPSLARSIFPNLRTYP